GVTQGAGRDATTGLRGRGARGDAGRGFDRGARVRTVGAGDRRDRDRRAGGTAVTRRAAARAGRVGVLHGVRAVARRGRGPGEADRTVTPAGVAVETVWCLRGLADYGFQV